MDYVNEITRLRDRMHQEIICTVITDNRLEPEEFEIAFKYPIECTVQYYRPTIHNGNEDVIITGIDGSTNELIAVNEDGADRYVFYSDLKMEDLAMVHRAVISKNYTTKQLVSC